MKFILFCQNNYAYGILAPIKDVLIAQKLEFIWYVDQKLKPDFPYNTENNTSKITDLETYNSDIIFVPGNEVPYYLRGLKTQIFHGLAGEKKGHFRIRHYFDLYLTQGPYFTKKFRELKNVHKNFDVIETGWPKLDIYGKDKMAYKARKSRLLDTYNTDNILLYAPTFSPKLTSAPFLISQLETLATKNKNKLILIKFHPLMHEEWIAKYKDLANRVANISFQSEKNIIPFLMMADILISDTSSVIYEFLLLDKPVITFNNISEKIFWENSKNFDDLETLVQKNLTEDPYKASRNYIKSQFHPYNDGKSAERMVSATLNYIAEHGVPGKRKLSILRRLKIHSLFGKPSKNN
jgi:CDP-glycerol glycerophosphotransferase (TagB/SpsB family)